ncbi:MULTISPECIES: hypothetical protein [Streptococcus]|jgi:hypothetical protein|uniref:Uncharacterized protein n=2 Tax=Streptococcus TaxID=1301 RepID=A0A428E3Y4_STRMT|nr:MULTISPECIES: hypothetical protein [Streptococcus]EBN0316864.1 hypothetical protein [Salmonella enterica subsp. enterica serovar Typhi]QPT02634.1 hypothetical protein I6G42_04415 [Streptococcus oralis]RSJ04599.1 hypothetical protein D8838_05705 [Streptococcus mitis]CAK1608269.1 hypothetical protein SDENT7746_02580 [Streptococcus oralis subsp. dentisani]
MKKLFRIHFAAIAVSDLLLLAFFISKTDLSVDWLLLSGFIFILAQALLLFRLVVRLKHHFSEIYPQMNKKIRLYYLGILSVDLLLLILLVFTSYQRFSSLMPIVTSCHSTFYYIMASHIRENYPDFYDKHISFWECL